MKKNIYWKKIDLWCAYPFHQEIDRREIHFYTKKRYNYKNKIDFVCDSQVVGIDRIKIVADFLNIHPKNLKLIKL